MRSDKDSMLESDHLDELLEVPAPAQPVVVVEYRSRGVPSWVFFPLLFVIPFGAILVYHRMVVERYRVQAAQANSLLELEINNERAAQPLVRKDPPPTTVLPGAQAIVAPGDADPSRLAPDPPAATTTGVGTEKAALASAPVRLTGEGPAGAASSQPARADQPATAQAIPPDVAPDNPPAGPEKTPRITMRSILRNPFADGADAPMPPVPAEKAGSALDVDKNEKAPTARTQGAAPAIAPAAAVEPLAPLPTKEESLLEIEKEAARKQAEIIATNEGKNADIRAQRFVEQLKFRQQLREVIQAQGNQAGPEIDNLAKRYGYEYDPMKWPRANYIWNYTRTSQAEKVKQIRFLELPETVILNFLSDDIHKTVGQRNGPRNEGEVRVFAAKRLLPYPDPKASPAERPGGNAGVGSGPAESRTPSRKIIVSTPR